MSRPILVGLALRDDDAAPLALARTLAGLSGAPLALASVFPFDTYAPIATVEYVVSLQDDAQRRIDEVAASLRGDAAVTTHIRQGGRAAELHELAEELGALAVVVGSSHRGTLGRVLAGDVAAGLLHGTPCPVVVAPRGYEERPVERIGVAFAPTEEGRAAAAAAFGIARRTGASVELISVVDVATMTGGYVIPGWAPPLEIDRDKLDRHANEAAERTAAELGADVPATCTVRHGAVVQALGEATATLDLLVCGSRGYGALRSAMAGGVSRALAHGAACPLLLVPRRMPEEAAALWGGHAMMRAQ